MHMYMHKHGCHRLPWQLSACANTIYQVLFLLPLLRSWEEVSFLEISHPVAKVLVQMVAIVLYSK